MYITPVVWQINGLVMAILSTMFIQIFALLMDYLYKNKHFYILAKFQGV